MPRRNPRPLVVGFGELLWDDFPDGRRPGGAPANFACHSAQLGCRAAIITRIGNEPAGRELLDCLRPWDIDASGVQVDDVAPTGRVSVSFDDAHQPEYTIHQAVAWDRIELTDQVRALAAEADAVCFGSLVQRSVISRRTLFEFLSLCRPDCVKVCDINLRQNEGSIERIEDSLRVAQVLKLNEDEALVLADALSLDRDPARFGGQLRDRYGPRLVVITRGARGCSIWSASDGLHSIPGVPASGGDPVGAGDAFSAGLILALLHGRDAAGAAQLANQVGSLAASRFGGMPDLRAEYRNLLRGQNIPDAPS